MSTDSASNLPTEDREAKIASLVEEYLQKRREDPARHAEIEREIIAGHPELSPDLANQLRLVEVVFLATRSPGEDNGSQTAKATPVPKRWAAERLIRVRCAHCGNKLNLVAEGLAEVNCPTCGSSIPVEPDGTRTDVLKRPQTVGRFRIVSVLGKGAFGTAYRALDPELSRTVAVKVPLSGSFQSDLEKQRFLREARSAARLQHPNIVQVFEVDLDGDVPYIVSELINGVSLADLISSRQLNPSEAAHLIVQVARAVDYAHHQGIIHRDIKPGNILLDAEHRPFITDFGLARDTVGEITMTIDGEVLGTPAYMSPEQAKGDLSKLDFRSDVYSIGVVFYRLLCGELPFRGSQRMLLHQVMFDDPRPPRRVNDHIPRDLETIVLKAMAKERDRRYATAGEFADDVQRWLNNESIRARPAGPITRLVRWRRRHPAVAALLGVLAGLLVLIAGMSFIWAVRERGLKSTAQNAREVAERLRIESSQSLAATHRDNGIRALQERDPGRGLLWLASAMRVDDRHAEMQRLRMGIGLGSLPHLKQLWDAGTAVVDIDLTGDGRRVLIADSSGTALIFNVESPASSPALKLVGPHALRRAEFSPDGSRVLTLANQAATLWDAATGKLIAEFRHSPMVRAACFSPNSRLVATAGFDGMARVWSAADGAPVGERKQPGAQAELVVFSPDAAHLLTASRDAPEQPSQLSLWTLADQGASAEPVAASAYVFDATFSPDGKRFVAAGTDSGIHVWDTATREKLLVVRAVDGVRRVRFDKDSRAITAILVQGDLAAWDLKGKPIAFGRHPVPCHDASFNSADRLIAISGNDGEVTVYSRDRLQPVCGPIFNGDSVSTLAMVADRWLAVGGKNGIVRLWDLAGSVSGIRALIHQGSVLQATFDPNGARVLTCGADGTARLWNAASGAPIGEPLRHPAEVLDARFSRDGTRIATACEDKNVRIWDGLDGRPLGSPLAMGASVSVVAFSPSEDLLLAGAVDGSVAAWRLGQADPIYRLAHSDRVQRIVFSPDGSMFATVSADKSAKLCRSVDGASVREPMRHDERLLECAFSPDGKRLATAAADNRVRIWRVDGKPLEPVDLRLADWASAVEFDQSGRRLVSSDHAGNTIVWSETNGEFKRAVQFHTTQHQLLHAAFHSHQQIVLASGSILAASQSEPLDKGAVYLYDLATASPLAAPLLSRGAVTSATVDPQGTRVVAASDDGIAKLWSLRAWSGSPDELRSVAELVSGWQLTSDNRLEPLPTAVLRPAFEKLRGGLLPRGDEADLSAAWRIWTDSFSQKKSDSE